MTNEDLKAELKKASMTHEDLSKKVGVSRQTVGKWCSGKHSIGAKFLGKIRLAFHRQGFSDKINRMNARNGRYDPESRALAEIDAEIWRERDGSDTVYTRRMNAAREECLLITERAKKSRERTAALRLSESSSA